jgi:hypothetical protein
VRARRTVTFIGVLSLAAGALSATTGALPVGASDGLAKQAARGEIRAARIPITVNTGGAQSRATTRTERVLPFLSAGTIEAAKAALEPDARDTAGDTGSPAGSSASPTKATLGCGQRNLGQNVRVNQDCTYRRQAEEQITFNPADPNNLLAGQNDSRVGYNQCGIDYSLDNGKTWGDLLPPFRQKQNQPLAERPTASDPNKHTIAGNPGTEHTYDADSDPTVAFDSQGNGFFSCVAFDVNSDASLLWVGLSPKEAQGSFFYNLSAHSRRFVVAEDNTIHVFHDKNFITADKYASSPNRDNVYVTWTVFKSSPTCGLPNPKAEERYCSSPIYGSMSTNHGRTWSTPELISGTSTALCSFGNFFDATEPAHACNFDQGSEPSVLPNGELEVIFNNGNTAADNPNSQQLGVHCKPSGSSPAGTAHLNCASPAKVGDDVTVDEPQCDFGRGPEECIPGAYIRTNDFPRINHNTQNGHLYATWQDYRNGEFDIQMSMSTDGGMTWHGTGTVNPDRGLDHYFPDAEQALASGGDEGDNDGDRVGDSYYRTERVPNENSTPPAGFAPCNPAQRGNPNACDPGVGAKNSDYVLAGGTGSETPYNFKVLSPAFGPPDGVQTGFNGDYSSLTINRGTEAHPIWSDTRNGNPFPDNGVSHDEDIFTDTVALPNGRGEDREGGLGRS